MYVYYLNYLPRSRYMQSHKHSYTEIGRGDDIQGVDHVGIPRRGFGQPCNRFPGGHSYRPHRLLFSMGCHVSLFIRVYCFIIYLQRGIYCY